MLLGAMAAGLFTALLTTAIHRWARVPQDAALGVTFTALFALGVILVSAYAHHVDLDPSCVLYGVVETAALDQTQVLGLWVPRITQTLFVITVLVLLFVGLLWKELVATSFDPHLATTQGYSAGLVQIMLMAMVAAVTVAAFEAVGSILVVAALIVPPATAYLLAERMWPMLLWTWGIGFVCAFLGRELASPAMWNTSVAGMMSVVAGACFALAVLFAPRHGVLAKRWHQARLRWRMVCEDLLALLWRWRETHGAQPMPKRTAVATAASGERVAGWLALALVRRRGHVTQTAAGLELTAKGRELAEQLVQRHRLWEAWLNRRLGVAPEHVHPSADRMMHLVPDDVFEELMHDLGSEGYTDPHGKPIPTRPPSARVDGLKGQAQDDANGTRDD